MNRTPPNLVYLTIYNPSLRSISPPNDDDEDAEEQAHILFYTSKERAVSRDRMLRQIGLAKALVSFADMFNAECPLDTVHSQTRRMVMISPEPNFWIHACVELARAPRVAQDRGKNKSKEKNKNKGKEKEKEKGKEVRDGPVYDYEDGSVQDGVLKGDIMRAYERFKLTHGSFTAILNNLGQEALALQLERFWTPWAWSWSLEDGHDFGQHLGIALHPYFRALLTLLDDLLDDIPPDKLIPFLLSPSNITPPTSFLEQNYAISLPLYLMSLIPPPPDPSVHGDDLLASSQATIKGINKPKDKQDPASIKDGSNNSTSGDGGSFLNMDVRKWTWSGMLNFGKNSSKTSPAASTAASSSHSSPRGSTDQREERPSEDKTSRNSGEKDERKATTTEGESGDNADKGSIVEAAVDQNALDDAISSNVSPTSSPENNGGLSLSPSKAQTESGSAEELPLSEMDESKREDEEEDEEKKTIRGRDIVTPKAPPVFLRKTVHLQDDDDPLVTSQRKVHFLVKGQWMLALIEGRAEFEEGELLNHLDSVAGKSEKFFESVEEVVQEEILKSASDSIPSASKILQPLDIHITSTGKYTFGSKDFQSNSGLLHEAKALQQRDPEIWEVFSRGQNPQHWYMARRTFIQTGDGQIGGGVGEPAEVYMQVFRKETSLADVDNVMTGVVKSWKAVVEDVAGL